LFKNDKDLRNDWILIFIFIFNTFVRRIDENWDVYRCVMSLFPQASFLHEEATARFDESQWKYLSPNVSFKYTQLLGSRFVTSRMTWIREMKKISIYRKKKNYFFEIKVALNLTFFIRCQLAFMREGYGKLRWTILILHVCKEKWLCGKIRFAKCEFKS